MNTNTVIEDEEFVYLKNDKDRKLPFVFKVKNGVIIETLDSPKKGDKSLSISNETKFNQTNVSELPNYNNDGMDNYLRVFAKPKSK